MNCPGGTVCLIDNSNYFQSQVPEGRLDPLDLQRRLEANGKIDEYHFFVAEKDRSSQETFYNYVERSLRWRVHRYQLEQRSTECPSCMHSWRTYAEKGVDVGLAMTAQRMALKGKMKKAVIVSGDADFSELVKYLVQLGIQVQVVGWKGSMSQDLAAASRVPVIYLNEPKHHSAPLTQDLRWSPFQQLLPGLRANRVTSAVIA